MDLDWKIVLLVIIIILIVYRYTMQKEVYSLTGGYIFNNKESAQEACAVLGGTLATKSQMQQAQDGKADWCSTGWTADGGGMYPTNTRVGPGCGIGKPSLVSYIHEGGVAGANCYGVKPLLKDKDKVMMFNEAQYSMYPSLNIIDNAINHIKARL